MRKLLFLLTFILCIGFTMTALAEKKADTDAKQETKIETVQEEVEPGSPSEIITVEEMQARLKTSSSEDILYVKLKGEDEERVHVYQGFAKSRSLRKQFILTAPDTEILRLYTTNKATYEQMSKMLSDYEDSNANLGGYKILTDKDTAQKLEDGGKVYRFWFMKIEREKHSRRGSWHMPIGIGIGWGRHHHHHGGPWFDIGW